MLFSCIIATWLHQSLSANDFSRFFSFLFRPFCPIYRRCSWIAPLNEHAAKSHIPTRWPLEIDASPAEFPAVLINLQSRVIEADFHTYVRPIELPKLDQFCEEYTGITQNDVNDGLLLSDTIRKFHEWLRKLRITKDVRVTDENNCKQNTVFVTWTDFDLGIYLPKECARKHIKLPAYFDKWIDIRDYYSVSISIITNQLDFVVVLLSFGW